MNKSLSNKQKWALSILFSFLLAGAIDIQLMIWRTFSSTVIQSTHVPITLHTPWEIAALFGIYHIMKRLGVSFEDCLVKCYVGMIIVLLIVGVIQTLTSHRLQPLTSNYYGIISIVSTESVETSVGHYGTMDQDVSTTFLSPILVKPDNDSEYIAETDGDNTVKWFLFWQTGMAYGFDPAYIETYHGGTGILERIKLFLTVGPAVILESFIKGTFSYFILILGAQAMWFHVRKEHFWWPN